MWFHFLARTKIHVLRYKQNDNGHNYIIRMIIFYSNKAMRYNIYSMIIIIFVTTTSDYIFSYSVFLLVYVLVERLNSKIIEVF